MQTIVLGPHIDLHPGYHGSMICDPPEGVSYYRRGGRHRFLFSGDSRADERYRPFEEAHFAEMVDFGPGPQVVHSPRWPVVGRTAWIADLDDFGFPFLLGRYLVNPSIESLGIARWSPAQWDVARRRVSIMLGAFVHPSCRAVLFWTRRARESALEWIDRLGLAREGRVFAEKSLVLYPAHRPALPQTIEKKWRSPGPIRVLFVGGDFRAKNGRLALDVFRRLAADLPGVRLTYVGEVPPADLERAEGVDARGRLPRSEVLSLFRRAHVLFHPAHEESFGMVFAEAAANGLGVVAARGKGMEHVGELFDESHGVFVDRARISPEAEAEAFEDALRELLIDPEKARSCGLATYRATTEGPLSLDLRNRRLSEIYRSAAAEAADEGFAFPEIEGLGELPMTSDELSQAQREFLDRSGVLRRNFYSEPIGRSAAPMAMA